MSFSRNLSFAAVAFVLWSAAYNLMAPLLPLYARELGASSLQMGLVGGTATLGAVALVLPLSLLSDRFGRRPALLLGWLASAAGLFLMWPARAWSSLLPGAFLSLAPVAALPTLNALALGELPDKQRARGFALLYAAAPSGALVGAAIAGLLGSGFGLRTTILVAGCALVVAALALLPITEGQKSAKGEKPAGSARPAGSPSPGGRGQGWMMTVFGIAAGGAIMLIALPGNFIVPYLKEVSHTSLVRAGLAFAVLAAAQLGWSLLFSVWPRDEGKVRLGGGPNTLMLSRSTLKALTVCLAANSLFGLLLPAGWGGATVLALLFRGSQFTLQSLGSALLGDVVSPGPRLATRLTLFSAFLGLGAAGAPVVGGWLYGVDPALPFWVTGGAAAFGTVLLAGGTYWLSRTRNGSPATVAGAGR